MPEYPHVSCPPAYFLSIRLNCVALHGDPLHRYEHPRVGVLTPYEREALNEGGRPK